MKTARRSLFQRLLSPLARVAGFSIVPETMTEAATQSKRIHESNQDVPLYSGHTKLGNLVFVSGAGASTSTATSGSIPIMC